MILNRDWDTLGDLMDANFELRRKTYGEKVHDIFYLFKTMDFVLQMMDFVLKNDGLCVKT